MSSLYRGMDGWVPGADFIFLEQMPGPASARGLGGVQFRESIKVLCSLAPLLLLSRQRWRRAKDTVSGPAGDSQLRSFVSRQLSAWWFPYSGDTPPAPGYHLVSALGEWGRLSLWLEAGEAQRGGASKDLRVAARAVPCVLSQSLLPGPLLGHAPRSQPWRPLSGWVRHWSQSSALWPSGEARLARAVGSPR